MMNNTLSDGLRSPLYALFTLLSLLSLSALSLVSLSLEDTWAQGDTPSAPPAKMRPQATSSQATGDSAPQAPSQTGLKPLGANPTPPEPPAPPKPQGPPPPPPTAELRCEAQEVEIGVPVTCVVEVRHPSTMTAQVILSNVYKSEEKHTEKQSDQSLLTRRAFTLKHYLLDRPLRIKDISVTWSAIGGHSGKVKLPPLKLKLKSLITGVSQPQLRDLSNPRGRLASANPLGTRSLSTARAAEREREETELKVARRGFWARHAPPPLQQLNHVLVVLLSAIVIGILGFALGWVIRRWMERYVEEGPYVDPRPAHIIAWSELDDLTRAKLIEAEAYKPYSQRISEIMRAYFGRRYQFHGLEMTSDELREQLESRELSAEAKLLLDHFLSDTDLIKFADLTGSASVLISMEERARLLIDLTREMSDEDSRDSDHDSNQASSPASSQDSSMGGERGVEEPNVQASHRAYMGERDDS